MRYARSAWPRPPRSMLNSFRRIRWKQTLEELYGPPDGYLAGDGTFSHERRNATDKAVYEIEIKPEDGLYPLPYMARQKDGSAWEDDFIKPGSNIARQPFFLTGRAASKRSIGCLLAWTGMPA